MKQYVWVIDVLAVLFCAFFAAKITSVYIAKSVEISRVLEVSPPPSPAASDQGLEASENDYKVVINRNIFDSSEVPAEVTPEQQAQGTEEAAMNGEAVKTSLGIKVFGVLVVGSGTDERSSATVQGTGGNAVIDTYAVGTKDGFAPSTKLTRVRPDRIEFVNGNRLEYALLEEEGGGSIFGPPPQTVGGTETVASAPRAETGPLVKAAGENKFVIDQAEVDNAMKNLDQLYTEVRAVPNFAGGKVSGVKILSVKQGSLFDKLGLRRGDILERINGMELDVKKGFEIFGTLKDEKRLTLDLVRQGQNQTVEYEIR